MMGLLDFIEGIQFSQFSGVFGHQYCQHCDVLCRLEALPALLQASLDNEESVRVAAPASVIFVTFATHSSHIGGGVFDVLFFTLYGAILP